MIFMRYSLFFIFLSIFLKKIILLKNRSRREKRRDGHVVLILEKDAQISLSTSVVYYTRASSGDIVCVLPLHW